MIRSLPRFSKDSRGSIAIQSALVLLTFAGFSALAVDVGSFYFERRKLQSAADLAALAAAGDLVRAGAAADATIRENGFSAAALSSVQLGSYAADAAVPSGSRFTPSVSGSSNAARIVLAKSVP